MKSKLVPIRFNEADQKDLDKLMGLFGLSHNEYGSVPSSIKLAVKLCITLIEKMDDDYKFVIQCFNDAECANFFKTMSKRVKAKKLLESAEKLEKQAEKVLC